MDSEHLLMLATGIPVVVAAGNSQKNAINVSPASSPNAITVGATDINDKRAWFSNFGTRLDLFAPGVSVLSAWRTSDASYAYLDGTSQGMLPPIRVQEKVKLTRRSYTSCCWNCGISHCEGRLPKPKCSPKQDRLPFYQVQGH